MPLPWLAIQQKLEKPSAHGGSSTSVLSFPAPLEAMGFAQRLAQGAAQKLLYVEIETLTQPLLHYSFTP